jgi:hypothetical protein
LLLVLVLLPLVVLHVEARPQPTDLAGAAPLHSAARLLFLRQSLTMLCQPCETPNYECA